MIVVASDNADVVEEISTLLKQKGDLFSVAADGTLALATARADRASLLIIDTTSSSFNGFSLCHEIRSDPALAALPVLCIIEPVDLGALLSVLDSTADGFLSSPFDLGSLSAAISDLQDRQAAGPAPGAVRTQFRISHDGRDYTITADRRQLLEFLLAAFETAVRVRREREQVESDLKEDIREISERLGTLTAERDLTVSNLHGEIEERGREIARLNAAIAAKEQEKELLNTQKENVARELKELGALLETTRRSDEEKGRQIATLAADLDLARDEKERADAEYARVKATLEGRIRETLSELNGAQSTVAALNVQNAEAERAISDLRSENTRNEEKIRALTGELEQAARERDASREENTRNEEKIRALTGELEQAARERDASREENTRNEEKIRALTAELEQAARERDASREENTRNEEKIRALTAELEQAARERDASREENTRNEGKIRALTGELEQAARERDASREENTRNEEKIRALTGELEQAARERDASREENTRNEEKIRALTGELEQAARERDASREENTRNEEKIRALTAELEQAARERDASREECERLKESASQARAALLAKEQEVRSAIDNLNAGLRSLEEALEQNLRQLGKELATRRELEKQVESLMNERDALLRAKNESANLIAGMRADLSAEQENRVRVQTESDAIAAEREHTQEVLEKTYRDLARSCEENALLQKRLAESATGRDEVLALSRQCDQVSRELSEAREALEQEKARHAEIVEENVRLKEARASSEKFLDSAARDIGVLNTALSDERERARAAEERYAAAVRECADRERETAALRQELDAVRSVAIERGTIIIGPQEMDAPPVSSPSGTPVPVQTHVINKTEKPGQPPADAGEDRIAQPPAAGPAGEEIHDQLTAPQSPAALPGTVRPSPQDAPAIPPLPHTDNAPLEPAEPAGTGDPLPSPSRAAPGDLLISRDRWMDITKWAHHTTAVTEEQRKDLIANLMRLSKLVQKGRHLTNRQEQEIRALIARVQSLGYRFV